jgi:hypothetical protein
MIYYFLVILGKYREQSYCDVVLTRYICACYGLITSAHTNP